MQTQLILSGRGSFRRARIVVVLALLSIATMPAYPWGQQGHEQIARLAQTMLTSAALTHVHHLLGTNDMASVSVWADRARQLMKYHNGPLTNSPEAHQFILEHPDNDKWHFDDLPLGTFKYVYNGRFATNNDIVHSLTNCIAVLEGNSKFITTTQALRYIIHLVGDIHQPLHVGCGYYTNEAGAARLLKDPNDIADPGANDAGANLLWIGGSKDHPLHSYWDNDMVNVINPGHDSQQMLALLRNAMDPKKWKSTGDYHNWPARWAKDSITEASGVYDGVTFGAAKFNHKGEPQEIVITLAPDYAAKQTPRATRQLAKAGFHLAELLNRIKWK